MHPQHHGLTARRPGLPAIWRLARRLRQGAVVSVLGMLLVVLGLGPASQGFAQGEPIVDRERWMAELSETIGQRPLRQVIIPGSHDAGTFGTFGTGVLDPTNFFAQAQSVGITDQLNAGSRYFDLRARFADLGGHAGADYWNFHGSATSTDVRLRDMLRDIADWANQPGHEREILVLELLVDPSGDPDPTRIPDLCKDFLAQAGSRLLQPSIVPGCSASGTSSGPGDPVPVTCTLGGVWNLSMNEIWALPNNPTIITNWDWCTGQTWPKEPGFDQARSPIDGFYANQCQAEPYPGEPDTGIISALATALPDRSSAKDNPLCASNPPPLAPRVAGTKCRTTPWAACGCCSPRARRARRASWTGRLAFTTRRLRPTRQCRTGTRTTISPRSGT
ncbi:MAG: hypothetical protein L0Z62_14610 [Gemmataceae bacterium]|nr:hypothetical protein [Gemmataceae bacterium]